MATEILLHSYVALPSVLVLYLLSTLSDASAMKDTCMFDLSMRTRYSTTSLKKPCSICAQEFVCLTNTARIATLRS